MAGLTTGRTLETSQVVKVQHGEDHHYPQAGPNERGREEDHLIWKFIWLVLKYIVVSCLVFSLYL